MTQQREENRQTAKTHRKGGRERKRGREIRERTSRSRHYLKRTPISPAAGVNGDDAVEGLLLPAKPLEPDLSNPTHFSAALLLRTATQTVYLLLSTAQMVLQLVFGYFMLLK